MDNKEIGKKISSMRKENGLTQEELADKSTLSVRTIQRIESGEVMSRTYTLRLIAEALGVDLASITGEPDKKTMGYIILMQVTNIIPLVIPPLVIWSFLKEKVEGIDEHARKVINFQISMCIYLFAGSLLIFLLIPLIFMPLIGIFITVITIINILKIMNGQDYHYPLSINFLKKKED